MRPQQNLDLTVLSLDTRTVVVAGVALVLLYMLWQVVRMIRLALGKLPKEDPRLRGAVDREILWSKDRLEDKDAKVLTSVREPFIAPEKEGVRAAAPVVSSASPWAPAMRLAADKAHSQPRLNETFMRTVSTELEEVRGQVDQLQAQLSTLKNEWQTEVKDQNTSPVYSDAARLADQGMDVATIADRCGIPRGEAALVRALVEKQKKQQRA